MAAAKKGAAQKTAMRASRRVRVARSKIQQSLRVASRTLTPDRRLVMSVKQKILGWSVAALLLVTAAAWLAAPIFIEDAARPATASVRTGPAPLQPVVAADVRLVPEVVKLEAVGTSRALKSVTLFPASAGEVVAVHFASGDAVDSGQLLVELDSRDQTLAVELAALRLAEAQRLVDRYARAKGSDAIPPTDVDTAKEALAAARIEHQRAQVALDDRFIRAPFAGVVGLTDVEAGDRIEPTTAITTLDDRSSLLVSFEMPEMLLAVVDPGAPVLISTWNSNTDAIEGQIVDLGSRIDPATRTVTARASVENAGDRLRPGMSFRVAIRVEGQSYPSVPEVALQWGADGAYIWRIEEGKARPVAADIIQRQEGRVLVDAELVEGESIVVEGVQNMRDGREVRVLGSGDAS